MDLGDAVTALVGVVTLINLVLAVGIVRRLREHSTRLSRLTSPFGEGTPTMLPPGQAPGPFSATTIDGETVSLDAVADGALVAFLAADCRPCQEETPAFVDRAAAMPGGRSRVLVVVAGASHRDEYVARLSPFARVVMEPDGGPVTAAFAVRSYPSFAQVGHDGIVTATGHRVADLPAPALT
ncbi:redoxin domain-containing protein [Rhizomonospora bruguierae]|uniref:redoxin domain-containing protein n=1 Tax=Rhizomonospora bruguierae TaxID=1581705 RepID=UPI001BD0069A|nr:redoxin domain-containing protein [Micromonospora sp. NBRC 107566]